jgi:hypothetical protein
MLNEVLDEHPNVEYTIVSEVDDHAEHTDPDMRLTPPLSREGIAEVIAELDAPPADTPQRRATFARARAASFLVQQTQAQAVGRKK